jgi:hypothetical protein
MRRAPSSRRPALWLGLASLLIAGGCAAYQPHVCTYVSKLRVDALPSRIVVVPFAAPVTGEESSPIVTQAFALEIQRILCNDVIVAPVDDERLLAESALSLRGRVDIESLIESRKKYLADGFLFGTVTQYKPYDPPVLGVNLRLLSATTGEVIWAAGGLFDAKDADVRWLGESYYKHSSLSKDLYGPEVLFMSPRLYAGFVAERILAPLDEYVRAREAANAANGQPENE